MAKLIISRRKEWQNRGRQFKIFVDGENIDLIKNGEIKELDLKSGNHKVKFKIDWCESQEVEIEIPEDKSRSLEVSGFKIGRWVLPFFNLTLAAFFLIKVFLDQTIKELVYVSIPFLLIMMYYLTIGRKKYIEVSHL